MYLSNIKFWNFRKYGNSGEIDLSIPDLNLNLTKGLNVIIGENDSGKTAIIDAIVDSPFSVHFKSRIFS